MMVCAVYVHVLCRGVFWSMCVGSDVCVRQCVCEVCMCMSLCVRQDV